MLLFDLVRDQFGVKMYGLSHEEYVKALEGQPSPGIAFLKSRGVPAIYKKHDTYVQEMPNGQKFAVHLQDNGQAVRIRELPADF